MKLEENCKFREELTKVNLYVILIEDYLLLYKQHNIALKVSESKLKSCKKLNHDPV